MTKLVAKVQTMRDPERGATMVEYALMVALIAVVALVAVQLLGTNVSKMFQSIATAL